LLSLLAKEDPMLIAEAHVQTEHASRYLVQLCRHAQQVHRVRHWPRTHGGGDGQPPPKVQHVEWSETQGIVDFGWGQCAMEANAGTLTLRAEAADEENLQRVQGIIARDIERFGQRDHLMVTWNRLGEAASPPGATASQPPPAR
jgi:hypothetical protein